MVLMDVENNDHKLQRRLSIRVTLQELNNIKISDPPIIYLHYT
jgi:hypothetical protein